jgi:phosphoribosylformylglycinamidine cyclo-ligase
LTYAAAGVDLEEKDRFTESLESLMRRTHSPRVIRNPGGFAGLFRLDFNERLFKRNYKDPVLIACTDGCGTKVKLAGELKKFDTIGIDLVAMSVNDLIVQGGEPLFFLDYIAVAKVQSAMLTDIVRGVAEGCKQSGAALLGGETAEMPDVYAPGEFDLAGFAVGVVELKRAMNQARVQAGDVVLGLESDGIHSNGYSLVRKVVEEAGLDLGRVYPELVEKARRHGGGGKKARRHEGTEARRGETKKGSGGDVKESVGGEVLKKKKASRQPGIEASRSEATLGEVLLTPTRIYAGAIVKLQRQYKVKNVISGMAHITGSGMEGNLERALHKGVDAVVETGSWEPLPVFKFLQEHGRIEEREMRRVFNMGIGYTLIVRKAFVDSIAEQLTRYGERVHVIGRIVKGTGRVREV